MSFINKTILEAIMKQKSLKKKLLSIDVNETKEPTMYKETYVFLWQKKNTERLC